MSGFLLSLLSPVWHRTLTHAFSNGRKLRIEFEEDEEKARLEDKEFRNSDIVGSYAFAYGNEASVAAAKEVKRFEKLMKFAPKVGGGSATPLPLDLYLPCPDHDFRLLNSSSSTKKPRVKRATRERRKRKTTTTRHKKRKLRLWQTWKLACTNLTRKKTIKYHEITHPTTNYISNYI